MVVKTVTVGWSPDGAAFTNCTDFAYVTNEGTDNISVIDTETLAAVATITLPPGSFPDSVIFTPNGRFAYVTNENFPGLVLTLDSVEVDGQSYDIATDDEGRVGKNHNKRNGILIGGGAGLGALTGGIAGFTRASFGMTVLPSITIGTATLAWNISPGRFSAVERL